MKHPATLQAQVTSFLAMVLKYGRIQTMLRARASSRSQGIYEREFKSPVP